MRLRRFALRLKIAITVGVLKTAGFMYLKLPKKQCLFGVGAYADRYSSGVQGDGAGGFARGCDVDGQERRRSGSMPFLIAALDLRARPLTSRSRREVNFRLQEQYHSS